MFTILHVILHMSSPLPRDAGVHRQPPIITSNLAELQTLQGLGIGITVGITPPAGLRIGLASWIRTLDLAELLTLQGERSNHSAIRQPG